MRRMRILATAAGVAGVIAVVVVSYLLLELSQTKADLQDTQEALVQSNVDLQASMEAHDVLAADVTTVTGDLADVKADRDRLRDEAHELSEENRTLTHEKSVLTQEHDHLKDTLEQLTATHQQLTTRHLTLQADHAELNDQHSLLQQSIGTVQALESQAGSLRTEIARLEALHKPLILRRTAEIGALCTGSMEPKLTCLDTVTYLLDFDPADIVPGTMISFESRACWPNDPSHSYTGHRVMNIRVTGGIYYYWPKGDANSKADGCWVPHTAVRGYIIEVHKNTRPENAPLRNGVQAAKRAYEAAWNAVPAANNALEIARNAFKAAERALAVARSEYGTALSRSISLCRITTLCGYAVGEVNKARERMDRAFADLEAATDRYRQALDHAEQAVSRYERARDYYDCWNRNVNDSEYPGHIPYRC